MAMIILRLWSPSPKYCHDLYRHWHDTMILRVRRKFLKLLCAPTVVSEPRFYALMLYARVEYKWVVGDTSHTAYQHVILWFGGIVGWSSPDRHYMTTFMRLVLPPYFAHRWLVGVCFSNFSWIEFDSVGPCWRLKQHTWRKIIVVLMRR